MCMLNMYFRETEEQVKDLQKSLTLKSKELEEKKTAANMKLKEMLADQQKAEEEKRLSEQLQKELSAQLEHIAVKKDEVQKDLSQVSSLAAVLGTRIIRSGRTSCRRSSASRQGNP